MGIIYKIENKLNGKIYIGQSKLTLEERLNNSWHGHFVRAFEQNSNQYIHTALRHYGKDTFTYEVVETVDDALLDEREKYWIAHYDSYNNGYNQTLGGCLGDSVHHSDETRQYISQRTKEAMTPEVCKKISERTKEAMSNPEIRKKISENMYKNFTKEEIAQKISAAKKGKKAWNSGKKMSKEWCEQHSNKGFKMTEEQRKKISERTKAAMARPEVKAKLGKH